MNKYRKSTSQYRNHWMRKIVTTVTGLALLFSMVGCGSKDTASQKPTSQASASTTITIGGKDFSEQDILANMMKLLIEKNTKIQVQMKTGLGSNLTWNAIKEGKIDAYVEYTGTGLINILKHEPVNDPEKVYNIVSDEFHKQYGITWLKPLGFNNTYVLAMRKQHAEELGIKTISDLAAQSNKLVFGSGQEWLARKDAYPALQELYHTNFKSVETMSAGLWYPAIKDKKVDIITPYSTDGKIPKFDLTLLVDDKHLFPPYYAVPIIRDSVLEAHPELKDVLGKLANQINETEMQKMNAAVDIDRKPAAEVAEQWLKQKGLL